MATWYSLGQAIVAPRILADELIHLENARSLFQNGALTYPGYGFVTPAVDSIAYAVTDDGVTSYRLIQAFNAAIMASAVFPAYLLARRPLSHRWALVVATFTVAVPWMTYSRFVMTEAIFYPLFLVFALTLVRAMERPTPARQLALLLAIGLAFGTRTQAIVLPCAVVFAVLLYGLACRRPLAILRAFAATWVTYGLVGIGALALASTGAWDPLGANNVLLDWAWRHPRGFALWTASNVTSFALGLGVLAMAAYPLGVSALFRQRDDDGKQAFASIAVSVPVLWLVPVVVLSVSPFGLGSVHERSLFYVAPLILISAIAWMTHGFPRPRLLTTLTVSAMVAMAIAMPEGPVTPNSVDGLSFRLWTQLEHEALSATALIAIAVIVGAVVLVRMRAMWPLVFTFVLATIGVAAASDYRSEEPRSTVPLYTWVDESLPPEAGATILWVGESASTTADNEADRTLAKMALYTELFNSQIEQVGHLIADNETRGLASDFFSIGEECVVTSEGIRLRSQYVVTQADVGVVGTPIARLSTSDVSNANISKEAALALWRVEPPLRLCAPPQ